MARDNDEDKKGKKVAKKTKVDDKVDGDVKEASFGADKIPDGAAAKNKASVDADGGNIENDYIVKFFQKVQNQTQVPDGFDAKHSKSVASVKAGVREAVREAAGEDIKAVFGTTEIPEEAQAKILEIFETAVDARLAVAEFEVTERLEAEFESKVEAVTTSLVTKLDEYADFIAKKWLEDNVVEVEHNIVTEAAVDFLDRLRGLFLECGIDVPADKTDVLEVALARIADLENKLNEAEAVALEAHKSKKDEKKKKMIDKACEGLTVVDADRLRKVAEGLEYSDDDKAFTDRLDFLKESRKKTPTDTGIIAEGEIVTEEDVPGEKKELSPGMAKVLAVAKSQSNYRKI